MTYQVDTTDFTPVLLPVIQTAPDLLVLSGVSPANAPQLIRSARELGYTGLISTETAQDAAVLAGRRGRAGQWLHLGRRRFDAGTGLDMRCSEFVDRYTKMFGEYNDEFEHQGLCAGIHPRDA